MSKNIKFRAEFLEKEKDLTRAKEDFERFLNTILK